jgi:hypothetical protein
MLNPLLLLSEEVYIYIYIVKQHQGACHHFVSGTCKKGDKCMFSHSDDAVSTEVEKMRGLIKKRAKKRPAFSSSEIDSLSVPILIAVFKSMKN